MAGRASPSDRTDRDMFVPPRLQSQLQAKPKTRPDASLRRMLLVAGFIVLWMLAIGVRLVQLQVSPREDLAKLARKQQQGEMATEPERGRLLDRQGRSLA